MRFVREAGWGNAMRYMLTGDHWSAEESYRIGITQQIAATPAAALEAGIAIARKIAACGRTEDFLESRRAEAEGRPPKYQGK